MTLPLTLQPNHCCQDHIHSTVWSTLHHFDRIDGLYGAQIQALVFTWHPSYAGHYPLAWWYPDLSQLMPLPMPGFLTPMVEQHQKDVRLVVHTLKMQLLLV
ncbi:hypothetical protein DSO57_1014768 [Entomophthora muscae]|uniref:Uncharacterized protein n=1 Tax=Entomophthora muscae TaxID=34485 RepID=A0ACC2TFV1_9FUNG|nr:hypothetical protein DSO57_1014768 [Entomophthora muscae]